jgi:hypothetical protein
VLFLDDQSIFSLPAKIEKALAVPQTLPRTGADTASSQDWLLVLAALGLLGIGWALRRKVARIGRKTTRSHIAN